MRRFDDSLVPRFHSSSGIVTQKVPIRARGMSLMTHLVCIPARGATFVTHYSHIVGLQRSYGNENSHIDNHVIHSITSQACPPSDTKDQSPIQQKPAGCSVTKRDGKWCVSSSPVHKQCGIWPWQLERSANWSRSTCSSSEFSAWFSVPTKSRVTLALSSSNSYPTGEWTEIR
jgi:hypothetical protein